jgi:predicted NUDIX family NTP pyrophosphohydrolase
MTVHSAGILLYRTTEGEPEVLLVHPGGPFWKNRDAHAWSIPKGEAATGEDLLSRAKIEFTEETGYPARGDFTELPPLKQPSGKIVHAWAASGDCDAARIKSNLFTMEWPPKSGKHQEFPEVDRAGWFDLATAREKLVKGQVPLIDALEKLLQADANG